LHANRFEVRHEFREVLEIAPVPVDLLARTIHGDGAQNVDPFVGSEATSFVARQLDRARHVEGGHAEDRPERGHRADPLRLGRSEGRTEQGNVHGIARDPRPEPRRGAYLAENSDAARELPQAEQAHRFQGLGTDPSTGDRRDGGGSHDLKRAEGDTEPTEALGAPRRAIFALGEARAAPIFQLIHGSRSRLHELATFRHSLRLHVGS
jgi:hypothetical protein